MIKKRREVIVEIPTTRAQTATVLDAISTFRIISVNVRLPYELLSKKQKLSGVSKASTSKAIKTTDTVTGYYFNFIASTLDVLDKHG